jgi:hypothetical protein
MGTRPQWAEEEEEAMRLARDAGVDERSAAAWLAACGWRKR